MDDLDALVSGPPENNSAPAEKPPRARVVSVSNNHSGDPASAPSPQRERSQSFGHSRCTIQFAGKEQAVKLGKRFKLVSGDDVYRCENEPIGSSTYWNNKRVCKECHDLGRKIQNAKKQRHAQTARQGATAGAARAVARGGVGNDSAAQSGGTAPTAASSTATPSEQAKQQINRAMGMKFIQYFYASFKNTVVNIPNGHRMLEECKVVVSHLARVVKAGSVAFGKQMVIYLKKKIDAITKDVKTKTNIWEFCYERTGRHIRAKREEKRQQEAQTFGGSSSSSSNNSSSIIINNSIINGPIEFLNVNIDDIKTETVFNSFSDVLTEHDQLDEQYDVMISEAEPSTKDMLKYQKDMEGIDVTTKEINVLSEHTLRERMKKACASTRSVSRLHSFFLLFTFYFLY